jgi:hypothetical protein
MRVLMANVPADLMPLLIQVLQKQEDIDIIDQVQGNVDILLAVQAGVDVVVLGAPQVRPPPGICSHLLSEYPDLRILVVSVSGDRAALYWSGLRQQQLGQVSASGLLKAVYHLWMLDPMR